jgi:hypothetical protein
MDSSSRDLTTCLTFSNLSSQLSNGLSSISAVVAQVGLFTSGVGTLVGAFIELDGPAEKEKEQEDRKAAERLARGSLANLAPDHAERVMQTYSPKGYRQRIGNASHWLTDSSERTAKPGLIWSD